MKVTLECEREDPPKGQMTLPAAVGPHLRLKAGDQLSVTVLDAETIVLKRRPNVSVAAQHDLLARAGKALTQQPMEDVVLAHLGHKHATNRKQSQ